MNVSIQTPVCRYSTKIALKLGDFSNIIAASLNLEVIRVEVGGWKGSTGFIGFCKTPLPFPILPLSYVSAIGSYEPHASSINYIRKCINVINNTFLLLLLFLF
jgi:hypothetical protein